MDMGGMGWALQTIVGGFLLLAVIIYVWARNRRSSRRDVERTEEATRELYREEDRIHRDDDIAGT